MKEIAACGHSSPRATTSFDPPIVTENGASNPASISSSATVVDVGSSRKVSWRSKTWKGQQNNDEEKKTSSNYPRKHSLTVPGEPRHFRALHRRESGSRSPIDSSYGGRSPSELSTPSPSCSNSINEDSSCSSGTGLAIELARKCTVSADSLLLQTGINSDESGTSGISYGEDSKDVRSPSTLMPSSFISGQRRISSSISSDRIHQPSKSESSCRSVSPKPLPDRKATTPEPQQQAGSSSSSSSRRRKGSMAFVSSSSGKIAKLLRRTHSAGCSKDVPSYALFLSEKPSRSGEGKEHSKRGRKQAPALEDMKQRLRFLRRRHTDSSLESSVRPSKDEVEKWAKSFIDLMSSRYGSALFRAFLSREFSEENIEFWIACEEFKKARQSKMPNKARKIFDDFLAVKAPKEVNLDPKLKTAIMQNLPNPGRNAFDQAQRKIQGLLESDAYLRFLQSELYTDLISHETNESKPSQKPVTEYEDS